jgi:hypothetical protein
MRTWIVVALFALIATFGVQAAGVPSQSVDLDKPGALEALQRDKPAHYAKVLEMMERVQAVPLAAEGQRDLRLEVQKPDVTRRQIETSFPAKTRMTVPLGDTEYKITVVYTKNPATVVPAK